MFEGLESPLWTLWGEVKEMKESASHHSLEEETKKNYRKYRIQLVAFARQRADLLREEPGEAQKNIRNTIF